MLPREEAKKQETCSTSTPTIATPSPWSLSRSKEHRIVRVSRTFGGKDRHSKVCTVKGLRDRRVRLSVPTAIQLYDLQDRLGLNQPSKAIDWLLDAAKHEIDGLPPLQFPPSMVGFQDFTSYPQQSAKQGLIGGANEDESNGPPYGSFVRTSSWDHQQPSSSLGLTAHDQNLDQHNFGFLQSGPPGLLLSSSSSNHQVLNYHHHHHNQAEINNTTQPYFPYTNRHDEP